MADRTIDRVYDFICAYVDEHHFSPTIQDIADGVGKSKPIVHRSIEFLVAQGKVTHERHKARTVLPLR